MDVTSKALFDRTFNSPHIVILHGFIKFIGAWRGSLAQIRNKQSWLA